MNKEKQIGEITKILARDETCGDCVNCVGHGWCVDEISATELYNAGYRKASEVAREIFECLLKDITRELEIARSIRKKYFHNIEKNNIWVYHYDGEIKALEDMECLIAELKKKYTEGANESHIS